MLNTSSFPVDNENFHFSDTSAPNLGTASSGTHLSGLCYMHPHKPVIVGDMNYEDWSKLRTQENSRYMKLGRGRGKDEERQLMKSTKLIPCGSLQSNKDNNRKN